MSAFNYQYSADELLIQTPGEIERDLRATDDETILSRTEEEWVADIFSK